MNFHGLQRMAAGQWHLPWGPEETAERERVARVMARFNALANTDSAQAGALLDELCGCSLSDVSVLAPAHIEYGCHLTLGRGVFINAGVTILNTAPVSIGEGTMLGPNCQLITVGHPVNDVAMRAAGWERGTPVRIGRDCWLGAGVTVLPGVSIGDRVTVGACSVVTRDLPDDCLAVGTPARVVRRLGQQAPQLRREREELPPDAPMDAIYK
ncbi:sugar O-acetyltransferase [Corynebacterium uberis]|uniref:sugar O-acetyltransferase n=1 Tax=Corynebacterium TaxID=1716 RepID=UPI001D0BA178|nr:MULTISPECIES: sugar O-acetyltransferase [Corynebacterium]MCZ9309853.1 sugar O-acetyltransferase [Corynebacterium sp. c6VSa_13]UDL73220.1 sugar O-acetyltransferase [Corynebacterium uberis]UDL78115.1 sugar O-acetyltransferase [Corynebacterium uberis]UDL82533.1 sugar O-acetyltransferase [Corynebacterium uberis]UDL84740.1 sugar O-acetyltransferase [Corynebacterium uberis]